MIVRPRPHWFRMLFLWKGSVLRKLLPRLGLIFAISVFALASHRWLADPGLMDLSAQPFTLLGIALAIFLGFRTNVSHDRYWEARKLWGGALNAARALARQALSLTGWTRDSSEARRFVLALAAQTHALKHQLRGSDAAADLQRLLTPADQARVAGTRYTPIVILQLLGEQLRDERRRGGLPEVLAAAMETNLNALGEVVGGCERIHGTPIPLTFSVMVHRTIYFYCTLLPFALIPSIGWYTPVFSVFVAYTFMALEAIAEELEAPFGSDPNNLPLQAMSEMIEATLREMLGDPLPPPAAVPDDYIVL
ncbi:MAG: bestrophin family ion channel [Nevskia sp.]